MKADTRNPADVIVERALALTLQGDMLMKGLEYFVKAGDRLKGFVNNRRLNPFFS